MAITPKKGKTISTVGMTKAGVTHGLTESPVPEWRGHPVSKPSEARTTWWARRADWTNSAMPDEWRREKTAIRLKRAVYAGRKKGDRGIYGTGSEKGLPPDKKIELIPPMMRVEPMTKEEAMKLQNRTKARVRRTISKSE